MNTIKSLQQHDTRSIPSQDTVLLNCLQDLAKDPEWALVQSDKTGQWIPMCIRDYISDMQIHILRYCKEIPRTHLDLIYKDTMTIINNIESQLSEGEHQFLKSWAKTCKLPSLRLSIKDHKPLGPNGQHPTRLIISAHNFTQYLSKIASKSIENTFKRAAITYQQHTIKNLLDLKQCFEEEGSKRDEVAIISLDIKDMYPQC
jgi:hypothetical protein